MARLVARMSGALLASCRSQSWGRAARSGDTPHLAVGPRLRRAPPAHAGYAGFVQALRTRLIDAAIWFEPRKRSTSISRPRGQNRALDALQVTSPFRRFCSPYARARIGF